MAPKRKLDRPRGPRPGLAVVTVLLFAGMLLAAGPGVSAQGPLPDPGSWQQHKEIGRAVQEARQTLEAAAQAHESVPIVPVPLPVKPEPGKLELAIPTCVPVPPMPEESGDEDAPPVGGDWVEGYFVGVRTFPGADELLRSLEPNVSQGLGTLTDLTGLLAWRWPFVKKADAQEWPLLKWYRGVPWLCNWP